MYENTEQLSGSKARAKILKGVNKVVDIVKLTLGPEGKNALLPRTYNRGPRVTNDGVTVSENILLKDPHERLAAEAFKEGSKKTNELVGDGTTTTAVIGGHLINKIFKDLGDESIPSAGMNTTKKGVRAIRKEINDLKDIVVQKIKDKAVKVTTIEELEKISIISIGKEDEKIAKTVARMVWDIGVDNHIDVVEGYKGEIETEVIKGMRMPCKVASRTFVNNPDKFEMVAEDVAVLVTNYKIDNPFEMVQILNTCKASKIAIFAPDFSTPVIMSLLQSTKNGMFCFPIKCPALRTEQLLDLATYTGSTLIDKENGRKFSSVVASDLGFATKIVVKDTENKEDAVILGGRGEKMKRTGGTSDPISDRIDTLKKQLSESRNELTTIQLQKRIANLSSAVGVVRVGASTSKEGLFLKLKIEDGVYACKAALTDGYVKGGGICLKEITEEMEENLLTESLKEPYQQIQRNAGGIEIGDDVIDPAKVVVLEVEHGVSIASTMITCDITIPISVEVTPGDGYADIAKAIKQYTYYWAKQQGMIRESEIEQADDMSKEFDRVMLVDNG